MGMIGIIPTGSSPLYHHSKNFKELIDMSQNWTSVFFPIYFSNMSLDIFRPHMIGS